MPNNVKCLLSVKDHANESPLIFYINKDMDSRILALVQFSFGINI